MKNIQQRIVLYLAVFLTVFTILPLFAPISAKLGAKPVADIIYWIYQWFCHQRPWRSYHLFDYQLAMDARMMLMFGGMAVAAYIIHFKKIKPLKPLTAFIFAMVMITPLGIDGVVQAIAEMNSLKDYALPFYESTNLLRSLTGLLFGVGVGFAMFPYLNVEFKEYSSLKQIVNNSLLASAISLFIIPTLVLLWGLTSSKYTPSSFILDSTQRFPGYNYEITTGAGHSTITRTLDLKEENTYINRAKKYGRQDLIDDYTKRKQQQRSSTSTPSSSKTITVAEVAKHNTLEDCYVIYESKVYKIPYSWTQQHPGGEIRFVEGCGKDITEDFNSIHPQVGDEPRKRLNAFYYAELERQADAQIIVDNEN